jgi:diguanylate cyclase (GGDEF)-like protein/PAS domain S-box-containing protein
MREPAAPVAPVNGRLPSASHRESVSLGRGWRTLSVAYGALWASAVTTYLVAPQLQSYLWAVIGLVGTAALAQGVRIHKPSSTLPWVLVAAALLTFVVGDSIYNLLTVALGQSNPFPSLADAFYLLTYPLFAGAMVLFHRRLAPHRDRASMLDALIIVAGLGLLVWIYWIGPYVAADLSWFERTISISYPLGDVLLLLMLLRLLLSANSRPFALTLLTAGTVSLLCADVLYGFAQLGDGWANGGWIDPLWFVCYAAWGAAALHPSMRELTVPQETKPTELRWSRLAIIATSSLIAPAVLLERSVDGNVYETGVIAIFSGVLFALVLTRLAGVVRQQMRSVARERALRQVASALGQGTTRASIRAVVEHALPSITDRSMVSWMLLRDQLEASRGEGVRLAEAYGLTPRGRVMIAADRRLQPKASGVGSHLLMVPVTSTDGSELVGLVLVAGDPLSLAAIDDAVETLASQVALALSRITLDNELVARRSEEHFRALIQNASDVIIVLDEGNTVTYVTPSVEAMIGQSADSTVGRPIDELLHEGSRGRAITALSRIRDLGRRAQDLDDWQVLAYDGRSVEVEVFIADLRDVDVVDGVVLTMRDVTLRRQLERELKHRAFHDPLTGLANRVLFNDRADQALKRSSRTGRLTAVLFCDLDDFKDVNDLLGHHLGDELLRQVGARIGQVIRPADTSARLGGDEFAVLMEDLSSLREAEDLAARLIGVFREPFLLSGTEIRISSSVGVSLSTDGKDSTELLSFADLGLYAAKQAGKSTWRRFAPAMQAEVSDRLELRADLEQALTDETFTLVYQPLVDMQADRAVGVEALVRWEHPRRGLLLPGDFLAVAEATGLIVPLGAWVLRAALTEMRDWRLPDGSRPSMHVNVSARQLQAQGFFEVVREALIANDTPAEALVLELTESLFLDNDEQCMRTISKLKGLGIKLAMDDFGTGYSSLGYLRDFPVDTLKLDKSFVQGLKMPSQQALVDAIIRIANVLDLELIAEGVETSTQRSVLLDLGCSIGQGFYYARPAEAAAVPGLLRNVLPTPEAADGSVASPLRMPYDTVVH